MSCSRKVIMGGDNTETIPHRQRISFRLTENHHTDRIPHMTQTFHDRLNFLVEQSGKAPQALSREAGLDKETLRKLLANPSQVPSTKTLTGLARVFAVSEQWLLHGGDPSQPQPDFLMQTKDGVVAVEAKRQPAAPELPARSSMPLDVPVMGTAAGSLTRGAFQFEGGVVDYVRRPPALAGAKDVYALFVEGESMIPQYHPGELIYIHPHRPARIGDIVVVQCRNGEHNPEEASLGIYRKRTEKAIVLGKHNPAAEIELNRTHVIAIHRVLTTNELFGV